LRIQRIAFFGGDVHISYVAEIAQDGMCLLCLLTSERPKFSSIPDVIYYGTVSSESKVFGKEPGKS
jgi:hypothetical protein